MCPFNKHGLEQNVLFFYRKAQHFNKTISSYFCTANMKRKNN